MEEAPCDHELRSTRKAAAHEQSSDAIAHGCAGQRQLFTTVDNERASAVD
jgi:Asp/Glu/hydantoin racemase